MAKKITLNIKFLGGIFLMDSSSIGQIVALVILVICSGYFSATETAFSSLNRIKIKNLADDGNKRAKLVEKMIDNYDRILLH